MLSMPRIVRPDSARFRARNLVPRLDRPLADPLSETKNWRNFCAAEAPSMEIESRCWTWSARARQRRTLAQSQYSN